MFAAAMAAVSLLLSLYYMVRTTLQTTPEAQRHWTTALYPWNAVLFPDRLTPRGRVFRRRFNLFAAIGFVSIIALHFG
jgi:hypothetical protein